MIGVNQIEMNVDVVKAAIQEYLNKRVQSACCWKVTSFDKDQYAATYRVGLECTEPGQPEPQKDVKA